MTAHSFGVSRTGPAFVRATFASQIDLEVIGDDEVGPRLQGLSRTPQGGADPGQELVETERLGDVAVGTGVEEGHPVLVLSPGRHHEDRDPARAPDVLDDPQARLVREPEIEEDDVRPLLVEAGDRVAHRVRLDHLVARAQRFIPSAATKRG